MLVAMSTGGVYTTADGGATWEAGNKGIEARYVPDPFPEFGQCVHKVARDAADPGRLYLQCHHGVYRSDDDGASWQSIADGLPTDFGFTVLTHPRRGGSLWLVPVVADAERIPPDAQLQVQHSVDAGQTWQTQAEGLPHPSYTCVLRDAAAVDTHDEAGLYVGTRNGDVFASADEGATLHPALRAAARRAVRAGGGAAVTGPRCASSCPACCVRTPAASAELQCSSSTRPRCATSSMPRRPTWPRLGVRMRDETGALRRHVNVFVDGEDVRRGAGLDTPVDGGAVVHVLPAVSGG